MRYQRFCGEMCGNAHLPKRTLSLSSQERECKSVVVVEESLLHRDTLYDTVYLAHSKRYQYLVGDDDDDEIHFDTLTHSP